MVAKYRPHLSQLELAVIEKSLVFALERELFSESELKAALNVTGKVRTFNAKIEYGLNTSSYATTGAKPGRKSAVDILREEQRSEAELLIDGEHSKSNAEPEQTKQYQKIQAETIYTRYKELGDKAETELTEEELEIAALYMVEKHLDVTQKEQERANTKFMKDFKF